MPRDPIGVDCARIYIYLNIRQFGQVLNVVLPEVELLQSFAVFEVGQSADLVDAER